ncbi:TetR/AcrR family transcriptional regulator [Actinophytocola sp.]|uniref:TetR/AcrR family transcriptional regulator n=1 Tax=Actinophytocola sp. TaxID=1872138 RepID=UPI003D6B1496
MGSRDVRYEPLRPGRHGLSRAQVRDSQRVRLLLGMAEAVAEKGYLRTTVADVLKRARISRETFYQHYSGKEDCFLAVLDESARLLASTLGDGTGTSAEPVLDRLERVLATYFGTLADQEALARVFFVESYAAGLAAQHKRVEVQERFVDLMVSAFEDSPEWRALPDARFACRIVVGGISSLVSAAIIRGETDRLREAAPKVVALVSRLLAPVA